MSEDPESGRRLPVSPGPVRCPAEAAPSAVSRWSSVCPWSLADRWGTDTPGSCVEATRLIVTEVNICLFFLPLVTETVLITGGITWVCAGQWCLYRSRFRTTPPPSCTSSPAGSRWSSASPGTCPRCRYTCSTWFPPNVLNRLKRDKKKKPERTREILNTTGEAWAQSAAEIHVTDVDLCAPCKRNTPLTCVTSGLSVTHRRAFNITSPVKFHRGESLAGQPPRWNSSRHSVSKSSTRSEPESSAQAEQIQLNQVWAKLWF